MFPFFPRLPPPGLPHLVGVEQYSDVQLKEALLESISCLPNGSLKEELGGAFESCFLKLKRSMSMVYRWGVVNYVMSPLESKVHYPQLQLQHMMEIRKIPENYVNSLLLLVREKYEKDCESSTCLPEVKLCNVP